MTKEVQIIVSGPVGCGKSALLGEIEILMKALGVPCRYADEAAAKQEKNLTHADWTEALEMYKPSVVLVEDMPWLREVTAQTAPTWIPVSDRLPANGSEVLAALSTGKTVLAYHFAHHAWDWAESDNEADNEAHITHWMPLPLAPKACTEPA
ncbi:DUF551 domain-containing protein [Cupriavidus taiwanensis]|uniref:DUF551 domain-containing protein n=1 Tax=Cupriavidus taiwanensis TaxID=164546 RepID=UPI000E102044|nr:DUF551 domain-containing protein [Cupriavidus taiwanensis]SOY56826.1 hypothetical protein CBM2592_A90121 [Cupriavidus taiwanensis]SOY90737.1 hypothetical protein CBM2591_A90120 [Cupriavidus taiwanensis]SOZ63533.1 hypothetical protein CBM2617_A70097 [Cupriavidus taiwanensis]SOZ82556.1 hypothetical protein CBM2618_A80098 [Cupriavidus taiwanensis]SOZ84418.1 hypothetical protein CBM2622_A80097 [Cupriavidus taiwanensis]